jgi:glycosyltransferase involved in cell wall biosynthesis
LSRTVRRLAGQVTSKTIGTFRAKDALTRLRGLPRAPSLARAERAEVARALATAGPAPPALVTTIVPTYGRRELLSAAVDSALAQTVTDHTVVVVVDGGEPPDLPAHPRVHVVVLERHRGVPGLVRNVGIRTSSSEYLAFLDDDNTWEPEHLADSLAAHRDGATFTYTGMVQRHLDGTAGRTIAVPFDDRTFRNDSYIDTSTIVVRRSKDVLFDRAPRSGSEVYEDWNLAFRLSRRQPPRLVPEVSVSYLLHPDGYMQRHLRQDV